MENLIVFLEAQRQLPDRKELNLARLEIQRLPSNIGLFRSLLRLSVSHNALDELPDEMVGLLCSVTQLDVLDISKNNISTLPDTFGRLMSLRVLSLSNNRLKTLPIYIAQMNQLCTLRIEGNPIEYPWMHELVDSKDRHEQWLAEFKQRLLSSNLVPLIHVAAPVSHRSMSQHQYSDATPLNFQHEPLNFESKAKHESGPIETSDKTIQHANVGHAHISSTESQYSSSGSHAFSDISSMTSSLHPNSSLGLSKISYKSDLHSADTSKGTHSASNDDTELLDFYADSKTANCNDDADDFTHQQLPKLISKYFCSLSEENTAVTTVQHEAHQSLILAATSLEMALTSWLPFSNDFQLQEHFTPARIALSQSIKRLVVSVSSNYIISSDMSRQACQIECTLDLIGKLKLVYSLCQTHLRSMVGYMDVRVGKKLLLAVYGVGVDLKEAFEFFCQKGGIGDVPMVEITSAVKLVPSPLQPPCSTVSPRRQPPPRQSQSPTPMRSRSTHSRVRVEDAAALSPSRFDPRPTKPPTPTASQVPMIQVHQASVPSNAPSITIDQLVRLAETLVRVSHQSHKDLLDSTKLTNERNQIPEIHTRLQDIARHLTKCEEYAARLGRSVEVFLRSSETYIGSSGERFLADSTLLISAITKLSSSARLLTKEQLGKSSIASLQTLTRVGKNFALHLQSFKSAQQPRRHLAQSSRDTSVSSDQGSMRTFSDNGSMSASPSHERKLSRFNGETLGIPQ